MAGKIIQLIVVVLILVVLLAPRSLPSIGSWLGRAFRRRRQTPEVVPGAPRPRRGNFPWPQR